MIFKRKKFHILRSAWFSETFVTRVMQSSEHDAINLNYMKT